MVVIELGFARVLADSNNVTDVVGNAGLQLEGILEGTDTINPGSDIILGALKDRKSSATIGYNP